MKLNSRITLVVIALLILVLVTISSVSFSVSQSNVWIPTYLTGECIERTESMVSRDIISHSDEPIWYHCNTEEAGTYVPVVAGSQCEYSVEGATTIDAYVCAGFIEDENNIKSNPNCEDVGIFITNREIYDFTIDSGDSFYLNTNTIFGDASLKAKYPAYGLRIRQADGFVRQITSNCLLNSVDNKIHTIDAENRLEVIPSVPFNAVSGSVLARSNQLVSLNNVESGKLVYITRPNFYNRIKEADDGFLYVDTSREFSSSLIECIPRTTGCSDNAKIIPLEEQSCDAFSGAIVNYSPVEGDSTKLCKYQCVNGELKVGVDCIGVKASCPDDKPLWDTTTGDCVSLIENNPVFEESNNSLLIAVLFGLIAIAVMVFIKQNKNGGKKKR